MIYLIDPYGNIETGHFWKVTLDFFDALSSLNLEFTLLTPTPEAVRKEREGKISSVCSEIQRVPTNHEDRSEYFKSFLQFLNLKCEKTVVIFTWLVSDSVEFYENFFSGITNSNISIFGISTLKSSSSINYDAEYSFEMQETFEKYQACKVLWVWHEPNKVNESGKKLRRLPEFHSNQIIPKKTHRKNDVLGLNFFGGLSSFRGISEILLIAFFNPRLPVSIKGPGYSKFKVWRPVRLKLFRYSRWQEKPLTASFIAFVSLMISALRHLPNVRFDPTPFRSEEEFLNAISMSTSIFIGCKLPHSSGVALSSLALGIPVIWFGEKGEAARILMSSFPQGKIRYRDIFVMGRIKKMVKSLPSFTPVVVFSWESMLEEIKHVEDYL